jgi:hypothetical protein
MLKTNRLLKGQARAKHRSSWWAAGLSVGLWLVAICCFGQAAPQASDEGAEAPFIELGAPSLGGPPSVAELNEAQMVFEELDEQVRISTAKLDPASLARKREIGRVRTVLAEADQQIQLLAAKIQRLQLRRDQLDQDRSTGAAGAVPPPPLPYEPATRLQQQVEADQTRLESLTRQRSRWKQRLDALYDQHVQALLEAGMGPALEGTAQPSAVERLLNED